MSEASSPSSSQSFSPGEWPTVLAIAFVTLLLISIPYLLGYTLAEPDTFFTGLIMNPEDSQSYFAKMLQGYEGAWLYTIPFTPEPHEAEFLGTFYIALGHIARESGLSLQTIWHVARIGADLLLFMVTYRFITLFLVDKRWRWTAYLLALFGSGLGWVLFLLNQPYWLGAFPVDFKMPEAHLFFMAMTFPHVALGTALLFVDFELLLRLVAYEGEQRPFRLIFLASLTHTAIGIVYPFLIYLVIVTTAIYGLILLYQRRQILWRLAIILGSTYLLPAPLFLYYAQVLQRNALFRAWDVQAATLSPPWPHYLLAYGVMLLLGLSILGKERPSTKWRRPPTLLWAWVLAAGLLLYAPLNPQRRFVQGLQLPLAILATAGLWQQLLPYLSQTRWFRYLAARPRYSTSGLKRLLVILFIAFMSLSNLYVLASTSLTAAIQQPYPLFRPTVEQEAVQWLREHSERTAVVLGAYQTGNYVAAQAGNRVVLGHWAETADWADKQESVSTFYQADTSPQIRQELLNRYQIDYVWFGPQERALGSWSPTQMENLELFFTNESIMIFAVR